MNARLYAVEGEIARHLAAEEREEAEQEALESRFADLSDARRAELLWDFIASQKRMAGLLLKSGDGIATIDVSLESDFWSWVEDVV